MMGCPNTFANRRAELALLTGRDPAAIPDDEACCVIHATTAHVMQVAQNFIDGVRLENGFYRWDGRVVWCDVELSVAASTSRWRSSACVSATQSPFAPTCPRSLTQVFVHGAVRAENYGWVPNLDVPYTANAVPAGRELGETCSTQAGRLHASGAPMGMG